MNLSGILVVTDPQRQPEVVEALTVLDGIEVHQVDQESGRIIAVQEAEDIHAEIAGLQRIKVLPHVVVAEMVYHYIGDDDRIYQLPEALAEQTRAGAVPACLDE